MTGSEFNLFAAFIAGLIGSAHCVAMCGGIVGVLARAQSKRSKVSPSHWIYYHGGRIFSYSIAGLVAGFAGGQVYNLFPISRASELGTMISGAFVILLGLYVAGWRQGLGIFEKWGASVWRKLSRYLLKIIPSQAIGHSLFAGMLWGWLPCGLVYSVLVLTVASGSGLSGALIMLCFGIGTLPMLVGMSVASGMLSKIQINSVLRQIFGLALCGLGFFIFLGLVPVMPFGTLHGEN